MAAIKLQVQTRPEVGKNKANRLRRAGMIPGVIYSKGEETKAIKVDRNNFQKVFKTAGTTTLIDIEIEGQTIPAIIKEVQVDSIKNQYIHVDFQKVNMSESVKVTVPVILVGRENIKSKPSILVQQLDQIEIECLPKYIPEAATADVSNIDFNAPIYVSHLDVYKDENITVLNEPDELVANLIAPSEEKAEETDTEDIQPADVPLVGEDEEEQ